MEKPAKKTRRLEGVVTSDKMNRTVVVTVTTAKKHPKYLKYYQSSKRFKAHDETNQYKVGDKVIIEETRPLSREKRWRVASLLEAKRMADNQDK
ncbi:MAG: 30S ribosomal protein S17 [Candidatus Colwellbacteria bacterium RBG_13_48_8]|uniref:Small ribosomal subunit protein uS17 n=1 Tax=Candidatus Colwellbacteria bacterium RBG_13_48_8 TaxID=1797685 RepID=A0A1G1YXM5_9BACT|nr:MAG: 30S ribosomal protein S17 [Candidatus Colwellbacteria bacterium RBG_13_48_8]